MKIITGGNDDSFLQDKKANFDTAELTPEPTAKNVKVYYA